MKLRQILATFLRLVVIGIIVGAAVAFLSTAAHCQTKTDTILNYGITSVDMAQTCYHLTEHWHEQFTPSQNCATIAVLNYSRATAAFVIDRLLIKHNHPQWAHFQTISAGMSASGIIFTYRKEF